MAESRLLKLKTDLKSLKFDPNNEPYILFPIGYTKSFEVNDKIPQSITDFYNSNRTNPDFPLRGGTISTDLRNLTFTRSSEIDKERIKKFLNDKPKGTIFLQKQVGLQLSNPKIETDGLIPNTISGIENTRFYNNGINTLTQVGVQGTGFHTVRHGVLPFNPLQRGYYEVVNEQNRINSFENNRLVTLKLTKLSKNVLGRSAATRFGIAPGFQNLFQYTGGPESVYGVGLTTIRRYDDTEQGITRMASGTDSSTYSQIVKRTYAQIDKASDSLGTVRNGQITYKVSELNKRYGIGDPGNASSEINNGVDRLNANELLYFDNSIAPWESGKTYTKDIIKFVFEAIDNDESKNSTAVFFRAFLSGITDNHNASINPFRYLGRGEEYYTYQGASRQIAFSFTIYPQSSEEFKPMYKKLNYLISQVYPDYSQRNKIMRAPLIRLTIGDYFYRLPGLIESLSITVDDNSPWEIVSKELPMLIRVSCTFKPIHDFLPRRETPAYSDLKSAPFFDKTGLQPNIDIVSSGKGGNTRVPFITGGEDSFIDMDVKYQVQNIKAEQNKQVQVDNNKTITQPPSNSTNTNNVLSKKYTVSAKSGVNVREKADVNSKKVKVLANGTEFWGEPFSKDKGWVSYYENETVAKQGFPIIGYIKSDYIK